jgi:hypothetical protein
MPAGKDRHPFSIWALGGVETRMNHSELELAWLAGLIDGEGAIWCRWPKRTNVVVEIKMCHLETIEKINQIFNGRVAEATLTRGGISKKRQYLWSVDTFGAERVLSSIQRFMVTKKIAADAAIQLCRRPIDKEHMDKWSAILKGQNA